MIESFIKEYEYYKNASLKKLNTYRLDVMCNYLIYPRNYLELVNLLRFLKKENIRYLILGNGSNVILARPVFDVVIKLDRLNKVTVKGNTVIAEAGVTLASLTSICMQNNLGGLTFAGGIPGLVGASTAMNAGAYKESMSDVVKEIKVITPSLDIVTLSNSDLNYSYRNSFLKENKEYICIETTFELPSQDENKSKEIMLDRQRRRLASQPIGSPSAGSVFRNPDGMSAGKLIEDAGLKGYTIGGARVSEKHANFIISEAGATGDDIIALAEYIKKEIKQKYGIDLILEQEIIR